MVQYLIFRFDIEMIECQHLDITQDNFWGPSNILIGGMNSSSYEIHTENMITIIRYFTMVV